MCSIKEYQYNLIHTYIYIYIYLQGTDDNDAFRTLRGTFLKSVMMTIGELDFNDNFIEREIFYPFLYWFWILFVIVMAVLFNNLLVRIEFNC